MIIRVEHGEQVLVHLQRSHQQVFIRYAINQLDESPVHLVQVGQHLLRRFIRLNMVAAIFSTVSSMDHVNQHCTSVEYSVQVLLYPLVLVLESLFLIKTTIVIISITIGCIGG